MSAFILKKRAANKLTGLLLAISYGLVVVASVGRLYLNDSGDISKLVNFFENIDIFLIYNNYSIQGDAVFRMGIVLLGNFFDSKPLTILTGMAFVISSICVYICLINIRSTKYLIYISPLFIIVFCTPMVMNLFASAVRSGIAFSILLVAIIYLKGVSRYVIFGFASLIHLAMIPIISLYFLFFIIQNLRIKSPFIIPFLVLIIFSIFVVIGAYINGFNITPDNSSIFFNTLIFYVCLLIIFTNKKAIKDLYGFISIGLGLIFIFGIIMDISFLRYIGNSIIFYLFFLIRKGELGTVRVFTLGYTPFFILTGFYAFANIG